MRLVARRVLTALPTLFGISLVTFALVHLTPGSVSAGAPGTTRTSAEAEAQLRRLYGLDLPVFVNLDIQDRGRQAARALDALAEAGRAPAAESRLVRLGTLAFPELFSRFASRPALRPALRRVVDRVLARAGWPEAAQLATGPDAGYLTWWRNHRGAWAAAAVRARVRAWLHGGDARDLAALRRLDQAAVAPLVARLLAADTPPGARARASQALAAITGHVVLYDPAAPASERRAALGAWRDWWRVEGLSHRDLSRWERLVGALTETRYGRWLGRLLAGDFGPSSYYRRRAWDVIAEALPVTLGLNLAALLLAYLVAVPLGVTAAVRRGGRFDRGVGVLSLLLYALPVYWVGLLLVRWLGDAGGLGWFPAGGLRSAEAAHLTAGWAALDVLWHSVLPVFCLGYGAAALLSRYQRAALLTVLDAPYVQAAWARGLAPRRVIWRHGVRNALIPLVSLLGLQIPYLVSGSVLVETIFDLPGMGSLTLMAIYQRDVNVLMGVVTVAAVLTWLGLLASDLLLLWADPRIRLGRTEGA